MTLGDIAATITKTARDHSPTLIAIEGYGGAGKTTVAEALARQLGDAFVVHMDDFILKDKLSEASAEQPGFDRQRLEAQVLKPLRAGQAASFQRFEWAQNRLSDPIPVPGARYVIVEGISAYHPSLAGYYDWKMWIDTPMADAKARGHARDGSNENAAFWELWAQNDLRYQAAYHPERVADFIYDNSAQL